MPHHSIFFTAIYDIHIFLIGFDAVFLDCGKHTAALLQLIHFRLQQSYRVTLFLHISGNALLLIG